MTQKPPRSHPFGLQRRHYIAVRVILVLAVVLLGVALHHRGDAYYAVRGFYLVLIVALVVWRIRARRERRSTPTDGGS
jgi:Flp pilus assembly protein TadB